MNNNQEPPPTGIPALLATVEKFISDLVKRMALKLFLYVITTAFLLILGCAFIFAGTLQMSDALGRACYMWLGNSILADLLVGMVMVLLPCAIAVVLLRQKK